MGKMYDRATSFPGSSPTRSVGRVGEDPGNEVDDRDDLIGGGVAILLRLPEAFNAKCQGFK